MKNIIAYINPSKTLDILTAKEIGIQIDNSLDLGWKREDIWVVTNFPYEYKGVKSIVVGDDAFYTPFPKNSKITATLKLFDMGLIGDELYWLHDVDAYQVSNFTEEEVALGKCDMGVCNYGRVSMWAAGTMFFYKSGEDIFRAIIKYCDETRYIKSEQKALRYLVGNSLDPSETGHPMAGRVKLMNISYNFCTGNMRSKWRDAIKPLKIVHFHAIPEMIDVFVGTENRIGKDFVTDRFRKFFL
jgi:hypothetical protein